MYSLQEVAEVLLKYDANVDSELGASKNKTTPLMKAAARGDLDMVKLLFKHNALIEKKGELVQATERIPCMIFLVTCG